MVESTNTCSKKIDKRTKTKIIIKNEPQFRNGKLSWEYELLLHNELLLQLVHTELYYWYQFVLIRKAAKNELLKLDNQLRRLARNVDGIEINFLNSLLRRITEMHLLLKRQIYTLDSLISDLSAVLSLPQLMDEWWCSQIQTKTKNNLNFDSVICLFSFQSYHIVCQNLISFQISIM